MTRIPVELSPAAIEQASTIAAWWAANRPASPNLFMDELGAALSTIGDVPRIGYRYEEAGMPGMRRLLLPRTRLHVYYVVHEKDPVVRVHGIWHAARGTSPPLT